MDKPSNPYATPVAASDQVDASNLQGTYGPFRNNGTLKKILVSLLVIDAMLNIFNTGILNYMDMQQYENTEYLLSEDTSQLDNIIGIGGLAHAGLNIILIIFFCIWINRSCKNAWLLDPPRMSVTPGWSVGYFFIPILLLWKPYTAMKEIRSASYGKDHALKAVLPLWWTFWLMTMLIGNITFRIYMNSDDTESYLMACKLDLVATPLNVVLDYLAIALVTGITLAQQRRLKNWHQ
ncbi:hypothetical protein NT6N_09840 [Oceaniferula spumae]|uniref:DUF4328 domain-containing protein n=1 Tax=Oceaniferula spumae TaxID=2979115 RepID=A0AAT9FIZ3_9BACT